MAVLLPRSFEAAHVRDRWESAAGLFSFLLVSSCVGAAFAEGASLASDPLPWESLGRVEGEISTLLVDGNDLVVGGSFDRIGDVDARNVARWDGVAWHPIGDGLAAPAIGLTTHWAWTFAAVRDSSFAESDQLFSSGGHGWSLRPVLEGHGRLAALTNGDGLALAAFNPKGEGGASHGEVWACPQYEWKRFGTDLAGRINDVVSWRGAVYACGRFPERVVQWDGARWVSLGALLPGPIGRLLVRGDELVAVPEDLGGTESFYRFDGSTWGRERLHAQGRVLAVTQFAGQLVLALATEDSAATRLVAWRGSYAEELARADGAVSVLGARGADLIAGGAFRSIDGASIRGLARRAEPTPVVVPLLFRAERDGETNHVRVIMPAGWPRPRLTLALWTSDLPIEVAYFDGADRYDFRHRASEAGYNLYEEMDRARRFVGWARVGSPYDAALEVEQERTSERVELNWDVPSTATAAQFRVYREDQDGPRTPVGRETIAGTHHRVRVPLPKRETARLRIDAEVDGRTLSVGWYFVERSYPEVGEVELSRRAGRLIVSGRSDLRFQQCSVQLWHEPPDGERGAIGPVTRVFGRFALVDEQPDRGGSYFIRVLADDEELDWVGPIDSDPVPTLTGAPQFTLFPNPASSRVELVPEFIPEGGLEMELLDLQGRRLDRMTRHLEDSAPLRLDWDLQLDGRSLAGGVYWVRVRSRDSSTTHRLVVVR